MHAPQTGRRRLALVTLAGVVALASAGDRGVTGWAALTVADPVLALELDPGAVAGSEAAFPRARSLTPIHWLRGVVSHADRIATGVWPVDPSADPARDRALWHSGRFLEIPGFRAWPVPATPDWAEDPYANPTWTFWYQSLTWLAPLVEASVPGPPADWETVVHYLMSWIHESGEPTEFDEGPWYDHAVALRTDAMVALWSGGLGAHLEDWQFRAFVHALATHGRVLRSFLDDPRWRGHNHGMFHAIALYNLARAFPWLTDAPEWRTSARERIRALMGEMVDTAEGVSLEQSFAYQFVALDLLWRANDWLASVGDGPAELERMTLARMARVSAVMLDPMGTLPAIGDTEVGARPDLRPLLDPALAGPEVRYVLTHGTEGEQPPDAVFLERAGYAIFRPSYASGSSWSRDAQVVVDAGPTVDHHGHQDALNTVFTADGMHILTDPGGPYIYTYPERQSFLSSAAHNGIVVDGLDYDDAHGAGDTTWSQAEDTTGHSVLTAWHHKNPDALLARSVVLVKPTMLIVLDRMSPTDGADHAYRARFQIGPGIVRDHAADGLRFLGAGGGAFRMAFASSAARLDVAPDGVGRVTTGPALAVPAPTVDVSFRGGAAWLLTVVDPSGSDAVPCIEETHAGDRTILTIQNGSVTVGLSFSPGAGPVLVAATGF